MLTVFPHFIKIIIDTNVVFYYIQISPQTKKQKKNKNDTTILETSRFVIFGHSLFVCSVCIS